MLRKTLVILRIVAVAGIICFFISGPLSPSVEFAIASVWLFLLAVLTLLGLTAWIEAIDTRLHPLSSTAIKERNIKAIIGLVTVVILAIISLLFLP